MNIGELQILLVKHKQIRTILLGVDIKVVSRYIGSVNIMLMLFREHVN